MPQPNNGCQKQLLPLHTPLTAIAIAQRTSGRVRIFTAHSGAAMDLHLRLRCSCACTLGQAAVGIVCILQLHTSSRAIDELTSG